MVPGGRGHLETPPAVRRSVRVRALVVAGLVAALDVEGVTLLTRGCDVVVASGDCLALGLERPHRESPDLSM